MTEYVVPSILMALGLVILTGGGEVLVRGASRLAVAARISPLVVGLTVVAYGTSSPELAVAIQASLAGQADIAVGNVVGSNICNVLLVLGLSALVAPLVVASQLIRFDVPIMIGVTILAFLMGLDHRIGRIDGLILVAGAVLYSAWSVFQSRRESGEVKAEYAESLPPGRFTGWRAVLANGALIALGLVLLGLGSRWLVDGAVSVARLLGISELVIGLTIVALGTSLPELVTSVVASIRGARDIAVGNIVGSNMFNILLVLGTAGALSPDGVHVSETALRLDMPVMIVVAVACLPIFLTGNRIARWEGGLFFGYYVVYITFLVLDAIGSPGLRTMNAILIWFALPLTAVTLTVSVVRHFRVQNRS